MYLSSLEFIFEKYNMAMNILNRFTRKCNKSNSTYIIKKARIKVMATSYTYYILRSFFKFNCDIIKQVSNFKMLRANPFACPTFYAIACLSIFCSQNIIVVIILIPIIKDFLLVHTSEEVWNKNIFRTMILFDAIMA